MGIVKYYAMYIVDCIVCYIEQIFDGGEVQQDIEGMQSEVYMNQQLHFYSAENGKSTETWSEKVNFTVVRKYALYYQSLSEPKS